MTDLDAAYRTLADRFLAAFPERRTGSRTVGRELEFPVVAADGQAGDVRRLWDLLLAYGDLQPRYDTGTPNLVVEATGSDAGYTIEVGVGTMEITTRPCRTLHEIKQIVEPAVERLVRTASAYGWMVLGYGIQPSTSPSLAIMTPKQRYQSLYRAMGAEWLWYTVTAADQCHVSISRDEAIPMLNFGNLMAPVLIAFCANSPVASGMVTPFCSAREGQHVLIHANEFRHGMPVRPFVDAEDFVRRIAQARHLIRRTQGVVVPSNRSFADSLRERGADLDAFLFHEHYVWNSARIRAAWGTLELRPACQQPWPEHMAAAALSLGLVEARREIEEYIAAALGPGYWEALRDWHRQVIRIGLAAAQPAPLFLPTLLGMARAALLQRGFGEETLLAPLWERWERRENPAQRARRIFISDGLGGLLAHAAIRPSQLRSAPAGGLPPTTRPS